jgi:hypothetical protein
VAGEFLLLTSGEVAAGNDVVTMFTTQAANQVITNMASSTTTNAKTTIKRYASTLVNSADVPPHQKLKLALDELIPPTESVLIAHQQSSNKVITEERSYLTEMRVGSHEWTVDTERKADCASLESIMNGLISDMAEVKAKVSALELDVADLRTLMAPTTS